MKNKIKPTFKILTPTIFKRHCLKLRNIHTNISQVVRVFGEMCDHVTGSHVMRNHRTSYPKPSLHNSPFPDHPLHLNQPN